jgi:hypothetical protein
VARSRAANRLKRRRSISVGGPFQDARASLCLYAKRIDLDRLTKEIGCAPSRAQNAGDVPPGLRVPVRIGLWSLKAPRSLRFEAQVKYLLDKTTSSARTWQRLRQKHDVQLRCAVFLRSWSEGADLPRQLIEELGRRHWSLSLTAYSAGGEEIVKDLFRIRRKLSNGVRSVSSRLRSGTAV